METKVLVPVKSGWYSKINWTQVLGFIATIMTAMGYTVPPDLIPLAVAAIAAVTQFVTLVLRTWFTHAMTEGSMEH